MGVGLFWMGFKRKEESVMPDLEVDKLVLFIAFVIPGFIALKTYELKIPSENNDSSKQLFDAITYSCINYALLIYPIILVESSTLRTSSPNLYAGFYAFTLLVFPVIVSLSWIGLRASKFFQGNAPHPTARPWDYVFSQGEWYWVIATLKDDKKVAGKYASKSFTSSNPSPEQIYLEESWLLTKDGDFDRRVDSTAGIIIVSKEISTIELFNYYSDEQKEYKQIEVSTVEESNQKGV
jgi:hypothetical protein